MNPVPRSTAPRPTAITVVALIAIVLGSYDLVFEALLLFRPETAFVRSAVAWYAQPLALDGELRAVGHHLEPEAAGERHRRQEMRRIEMACETQVMAQAGGAELVYPPMDVVKKTTQQVTQIVQKDEKNADDGPKILWAAVRRWMMQVDPSYME